MKCVDGKSLLAEGLEGRLVIRFLANFRYLFGIENFATSINNYNCPGEQTGYRTVGDDHSIIIAKAGGAENRQGDNFVEAFTFAESLVGERKVCGNTEDNGVV